jgi:hypothetical protein
MLVALTMLAGCVVVRSILGEKGAEVGHIQPGTKRSAAEAVLGAPAEEWVSPAGVRYALYEYNAGIPPHYGDAMVAVALDVVSFGVFEIIAYNRTQGRHPGEYDRRKGKVVISYDAYQVILGIFDESAEPPLDGKSGPYRWGATEPPRG